MKNVMAGLVLMAGVGGTCLAAESNEPAATPVTLEQVKAMIPKTWADSVAFKGDIRYRYETIADDSKLDADKETYTRQRDRIRARLGAEAKANANLKVGIRTSTGQSDPVSGNQTIGDGFGKKDFKLDLGYFDYSFLPDAPDAELHVIGGKMNNPFMTVSDDLVWDGDLTPEGVAIKGQKTAGRVTFYGNGGYMWVQERSDTDDSMLYAGQAAVRMQFMPEVALTLGVAYYDFTNLKGNNVVDWEGKNNAYGNSTQKGTISGSTTNKAWKTEYTPLVPFAQLDLYVGGKPLSFHAQQISNSEADDLDSGYVVGVSYGKAKNVKTYEIGYSYAELEKDATVGMFTDSDRWGGGTDGQGHKVYAKYQVMKNLQIGATYFADEKPISDGAKTKDYSRMQLDLVAAF
jgi:hypothetical protein